MVAFWLSAVDTLPEPSRRAIQQEFRRSNDAMSDYLSDTDVALVTTRSDTVVVETEEERYLVLLSGFDFPFGYLLVEPGYEEEFHTGLMVDEDLQSVIDEYFEFEPANSEEPGAKRKARIAVFARSPFPVHRSPLFQPGPRTIRPGFAPVTAPSLTTATPFTNTYSIPAESWCGCSNVARSLTVIGSKATRSAKKPGRSTPRSVIESRVATAEVILRTASSRVRTRSSRTYFPRTRGNSRTTAGG